LLIKNDAVFTDIEIGSLPVLHLHGMVGRIGGRHDAMLIVRIRQIADQHNAVSFFELQFRLSLVEHFNSVIEVRNLE
jgi:hypothetical protein